MCVIVTCGSLFYVVPLCFIYIFLNIILLITILFPRPNMKEKEWSGCVRLCIQEYIIISYVGIQLTVEIVWSELVV